MKRTMTQTLWAPVIVMKACWTKRIVDHRPCLQIVSCKNGGATYSSGVAYVGYPW